MTKLICPECEALIDAETLQCVPTGAWINVYAECPNCLGIVGTDIEYGQLHFVPKEKIDSLTADLRGTRRKNRKWNTRQ